MPEGPEVRTTVDRISQIAVGRQLTDIRFVDDNYRAKQVRDQVDELIEVVILKLILHSFSRAHIFA